MLHHVISEIIPKTYSCTTQKKKKTDKNQKSQNVKTQVSIEIASKIESIVITRLFSQSVFCSPIEMPSSRLWAQRIDAWQIGFWTQSVFGFCWQSESFSLGLWAQRSDAWQICS